MKYSAIKILLIDTKNSCLLSRNSKNQITKPAIKAKKAKKLEIFLLCFE
jgi:hypothetical protein